MRNIFFILMSGLLVLSACKDGPVEKKLIDETKYWFEFNNGSSWTYVQESDTNQLETVELENYQHGYIAPDALNTEFVAYDLKSNLYNTIKVRIEAGAHDPYDRISMLYFSPDSVKIGAVFWHSLTGFSKSLNDTLDRYGQYEVKNKTYNDVMILKLQSDPVHKRIYFARGVGIIRRDMRNGKVYLLKNYQLK